MKRAKGHERVAMFSDFVLDLNSNTELAVADTSATLSDQVLLLEMYELGQKQGKHRGASTPSRFV